MNPDQFDIFINGPQFSKKQMRVTVIPNTKVKRITRKVGNHWNLPPQSICLINHSTRKLLSAATIGSNGISSTDKHLELVSKESVQF